jgi:hypothetical protein
LLANNKVVLYDYFEIDISIPTTPFQMTLPGLSFDSELLGEIVEEASTTEDIIEDENSGETESNSTDSSSTTSETEELWDSGIRLENFDIAEQEAITITPKAFFSEIDSRGKVTINFNTAMNFTNDFADKVSSSKTSNSPS